ncbi:MAG: hypothetical protein V4665_03460 [Patescibacteria group bacterium]
MRTKYHTFLIGLALVLLLGSAYAYFAAGGDARAATASSLVSSITGTAAQTNSTDERIAEDTAFLSTLTSLNEIVIDTSIFTNKSFRALTDNTVVLETATPGRPNPFASIDSAGGNAGQQAELVITNDPTQITNASANLNGTVTAQNAATSVYFEYGPTETLGKTTLPAKQSMIGSFATPVTGLASKTRYFFRAVAKINNATVNGGIISFTTQ